MTLDPTRWSPPVAIAHRGSRQLWPENTPVAFGGAVEMGYRHIETDLRLTKDGVLVCFHDATVDRTTDGTGRVASFEFDDLSLLDAAYRHAGDGGFPFRGQGIRVPSLESVLADFPDVSIVVDLKEDNLAEPLAALLDETGSHERLIVGSFDDQRIAQFREVTKGLIPTSTGTALTRMWVLASRVGRGGGGEASALQIPTTIRGVRVVDEKLINAAHSAGLQVHVWTVNDASEMERLLDLGADGIVTDRPDRLKSVLESRGDWH